MSETFFKKCSSCKKEIAFQSKYYVCSVSSCNGARTGYNFCSVHCFERHVPIARHKDAAAIEKTSPSFAPVKESTNPPRRRIIASPPASKSPSINTAPKDILIVASKLKNYIKARSDMNTSASVMDILSEKVRRLCDDAIEEAHRQGRKTVLDRDFK